MTALISPEWEDLTQEEREAVHARLTSHGIDPKDVPVTGISARGGYYEIEVYQRGAHGLLIADQSGSPVSVHLL